MSYRELLPTGCPPEAAEEIIDKKEVFRLVKTQPPTLADFKSQRAEKPQAVFHGVTECQALGLSVFTERQDSEKALKLPVLRGRFVCRVSLGAGAGRIQQTGRPSHHTWWPLAEFDILAHSNVETA